MAALIKAILLFICCMKGCAMKASSGLFNKPHVTLWARQHTSAVLAIARVTVIAGTFDASVALLNACRIAVAACRRTPFDF
jgi:hypothetical protein